MCVREWIGNTALHSLFTFCKASEEADWKTGKWKARWRLEMRADMRNVLKVMASSSWVMMNELR